MHRETRSKKYEQSSSSSSSTVSCPSCYPIFSASSLSSCLLFFLYMSVLFISLSPSFSSASNICVCQCCEGGGRCGSNTTQAFTVYDSCSSGCTRVTRQTRIHTHCTIVLLVLASLSLSSLSLSALSYMSS